MKRGLGFGKIGLNLGQMKIGEKLPEKETTDDGSGTGGGFGSFGKINTSESNTITNLVNAIYRDI